MNHPCSEGHRLALAAAAMIGAPFKLHGRDPKTGLDCVGLVVASLRAIGRKPQVPRGYGLRNSSINSWEECFGGSGFLQAFGTGQPGDVLLIRPGPGQHHLMIFESSGWVVHAHAGLRRVARQPYAAANEVTSLWRLDRSRQDQPDQGQPN